MVAHLQRAHKIDAAVTKFAERMTYHADTAKWYLTVYELSGGGIVFTRSEKRERDAEGMLLWGDE
jgi:hypothetical protein